VKFDLIQIDMQDKRSVYTFWLRVLGLVCAVVAAFGFIVPTFFNCPNQQLPWNEESRILPAGVIPSLQPNIDQPKLTEVLHYKTSPTNDGSPCGDLNFCISTDGIIKGIWSGEYDTSEGIHCTILAASFSGNIDPAKSCIEGNRHNQSKLYFITTGTVTMAKTDAFGNHGFNGQIYFRGWLDPNYIAAGDLFITQNKKSYEVFTFTANEAEHSANCCR
jgi:hypothetical protein